MSVTLSLRQLDMRDKTRKHNWDGGEWRQNACADMNPFFDALDNIVRTEFDYNYLSDTGSIGMSVNTVKDEANPRMSTLKT